MDGRGKRSWMPILIAISLGIGAPTRGQDAITPIPVNVPCGDVLAYVKSDQADLGSAAGGPAVQTIKHAGGLRA
jgi:hypothetical protein